MIDRYIVAAMLAIFTVFISYIINFFFKLNYTISSDTAVWGQLGDYFGGLLNPILSFISVVLLIKSLRLQNEANAGLKKELINSEKTEKIRSFETLFFNMINSQKMSFDLFKFEVKADTVIYGGEAVIEIEDKIETLRQQHQDDKPIIEFLKSVDSNDQVFSVTRAFYIIVKMITEKLSNDNGFSEEDRKSHLLTLVNFTDFSLLRLIMISMQFMSYHSIEYLRNNNDFNAVLKEVELDYNLY